MSVKAELNREVVVKALALGIATIDALKEVWGDASWGNDRAEMKKTIEVLVPDDAQLERLAKNASAQVGQLVGHSKRL